MTSLIDKEILSDGTHLQYETSNWVRCWRDEGHRIPGSDPAVSAVRAITVEGELFWLIYHENKKHPFHADCDDPQKAIAIAQRFWQRRRAARQRTPEIKALRWAVMTGRKRGDVLFEDTTEAGLCRMGTEAFLRRVGLGGRRIAPAKVIAFLSYFEPQAGLPLLKAFDRLDAAEAPRAALQPAD